MKIFAVTSPEAGRCAGSPFAGLEARERYEIPDSSLLRSGQPFFVPDFAGEFQAFPSIVFRLSRLGKGIAPRFATRYYDSVTMGCAVIATDLLRQLRAQGKPWCRAVAFDKCCMTGRFIQPDEMPESWSIQSGDCSLVYPVGNIMAGFGDILADISRDITVKEGDLILASLSPVGIPLKQGTRLSVINEANNHKILDISIR